MFDAIIKRLIAGCAVPDKGVSIVVSFVVLTIWMKNYTSQAFWLNVR